NRGMITEEEETDNGNAEQSRPFITMDRERAGRIEEGHDIINRLSLDEEQGRLKSGSRNVEATLVLRAATETSRVGQGIEEIWSSRAQEQEELLERYAKPEGVWIAPETIKSWQFLNDGNEAKVYRDPNNPDYVLKEVFDYSHFSKTPLDFLDRIALYNSIFPEAPYELVGFTGPTTLSTSFGVILRQKYVNGRELTWDELPLIQAEMEKRGLKFAKNSIYVNSNYVINDVNPRNARQTADGKIIFIDVAPELNTKRTRFRGKREYGDYSVRSVEEAKKQQQATNKERYAYEYQSDAEDDSLTLRKLLKAIDSEERKDSIRRELEGIAGEVTHNEYFSSRTINDLAKIIAKATENGKVDKTTIINAQTILEELAESGKLRKQGLWEWKEYETQTS
ncbi:MAG: hypothetical protein LBC09_05045, partial [Helicobacteraceae bacterium]|nr:hypothetical protein [Helicobacteraceae bacterium]